MTTQDDLELVISILLNACEFEKRWLAVREIQLDDMSTLAARFDRASVEVIRAVSPRVAQDINRLSPLTEQGKQRAKDIVSEVKSERESLLAENQMMRKALEFYKDDVIYDDDISGLRIIKSGEMARKALSKVNDGMD